MEPAVESVTTSRAQLSEEVLHSHPQWSLRELASVTFDDEDRLVVNEGAFTRLPQVLISLHGLLEDGVTNLFSRPIFMLTDHPFNLHSDLLVTPVIDPI